jgi:hypothetical protein
MAQGDPALIYIFILILILFGISLIVIYKIFKKYKERPSNITLFLGRSLLLMIIGIMIIGIGAILEFSGAISNNDIIIMISLTCFLASIINSAYFIQEVFGLKISRYIKIIKIILLSLIILYVLIYIFIEFSELNLSILLFSFTNLIFYFFFYTYIAIKSLLIRRRINEKDVRERFLSIFFMGLLMDIAFLFIAIDSFSLTITIFLYLGLIIAILSMISAYLGFCRKT